MVFVEMSGVLIDVIHNDIPGRDYFGRFDDPTERLSKQRAAQFLALQGHVESKSGKKHCRNLIRIAVSQASRKVNPDDEMRDHRVPANGVPEVVTPLLVPAAGGVAIAVAAAVLRNRRKRRGVGA